MKFSQFFQYFTYLRRHLFGANSAKFRTFVLMKIEEAIVYCLATSNRGMRSEQIADMINRQRLHVRKDGQPVRSI